MNLMLQIWAGYTRLTRRWPGIAAIIPFIPVLALWTAVSEAGLFPRAFFPGPADVVRRASRHLDRIERQARRYEPELADEAEALAVDVRGDGQAAGVLDLVDRALQAPRRRAGEERRVEAQDLLPFVGDHLCAEDVLVRAEGQRCRHARVEHVSRRRVGQQLHHMHFLLAGDLHPGQRDASRLPRRAVDRRDVVGRVMVTHQHAVHAGLSRGASHGGRVHVELPAR